LHKLRRSSLLRVGIGKIIPANSIGEKNRRVEKCNYKGE
jgi:hypothetical protein